MTPEQVINQTKVKFNQALEHFQNDLKTVRTGRAHPSMLDGVTVEAYGTPMPLNQVAGISVPEPQLLQITPFDPSNLQNISTAIRNNASLGLNPMDDGKVVRVQIPPLNEERRHEYAKILSNKLESCMVVLRNVRQDAMKEIDQAKKDKDISEDDAKRLSQQVEDAMSDVKKQADEAAKTKESEIMTV